MEIEMVFFEASDENGDASLFRRVGSGTIEVLQVDTHSWQTLAEARMLDLSVAPKVIDRHDAGALAQRLGAELTIIDAVRATHPPRAVDGADFNLDPETYTPEF